MIEQSVVERSEYGGRIYIGNDGSRGYSGRFGLLMRCSMAAATVFVIAFHCLPCVLLLWIRLAPL